jgi:hypothetical protein
MIVVAGSRLGAYEIIAAIGAGGMGEVYRARDTRQRLVGRTAGWSPDGRLLYVLLEVDGFRCLYAIRIDPATGRATGAPMDVHHLHDAHLVWGSTGFGNAIVDGLFYLNQSEDAANIWMTKLQPYAR